MINQKSYSAGWKGQKETYKILIIAILLSNCCFLTYYFYIVLGTGSVIISQFFYIPIILAALWWRSKGLIVAISLAVLIIFTHFFIRPDVAAVDDLICTIWFIIIGFVVAMLSERIATEEEGMKAVQENEKEFRSLYEHSGDVIMLLDENGFFDCNDAALQIF